MLKFGIIYPKTTNFIYFDLLQFHVDLGHARVWKNYIMYKGWCRPFVSKLWRGDMLSQIRQYWINDSPEIRISSIVYIRNSAHFRCQYPSMYCCSYGYLLVWDIQTVKFTGIKKCFFNPTLKHKFNKKINRGGNWKKEEEKTHVCQTLGSGMRKLTIFLCYR